MNNKHIFLLNYHTASFTPMVQETIAIKNIAVAANLVRDAIVKTLQTTATKKQKAIGIVAAILVSCYIIRDRILKPPKSLRHLRYEGFFQVLKSIFNNESYWDRAHRSILPIINKEDENGLYVRPGTNGWEVHVTNPAAAKLILYKHDKFPKREIQEKNKTTTLLPKFVVGGRNIVFLNHQEWKAQRKIVNPAFHRSAPVKLFGELTVELFRVMDKMNEDTIDVGDIMQRLTLDVIGKAGFGFDFHAISQKDNKWVKTYNSVISGIQDPLYAIFPILDRKFLWLLPKRRKVHEDLNRFLKMLEEVIEVKKMAIKNGDTQNKDLEENEKDLLTLMIESINRGEGVMTDTELKSNLSLFFLAGHDTTSNTLSFVIYYLAKNPEIQQRAREEAEEILGKGPGDVLPTLEQTKAATYIDHVMKETLRINGPVTQIFRTSTEDTVLSGQFIPKKTEIVVDIFNIQHSEKVWKDADEFNPDRFAEGGEGDLATREGLAWLPFGGGARQCIGINFSLTEQRVFLLMLLRKFTWSLPENSKHKNNVISKGIIIGPDQLYVIFKNRY
ncbi:cytochrome P450 [Mycotypha africana]|uniref:cytochrome P450 n=1 Tax=Mycotypha africana TaxID=64632 RepID=UPI002301E1BF|nr:cytochrome P450 [Mycotypha africana]KAI8982296.1 cytochrome P450 [Mycotypha africana]